MLPRRGDRPDALTGLRGDLNTLRAFGIAIALIVGLPLAVLLAFTAAGLAWTGFKVATDAPFVAYILEHRGGDVTRFFGDAPRLDDVLKAVSASYFECAPRSDRGYRCRRKDFGLFVRGYFVTIVCDEAGRIVEVRGYTDVDAL